MFLSLFLSSLPLTLSGQSPALPEWGWVVNVEGKVLLTHGDDPEIRVLKGRVIKPGDVLSLSRGGYLTLYLSTNHKVYLEAETSPLTWPFPYELPKQAVPLPERYRLKGKQFMVMRGALQTNSRGTSVNPPAWFAPRSGKIGRSPKTFLMIDDDSLERYEIAILELRDLQPEFTFEVNELTKQERGCLPCTTVALAEISNPFYQDLQELDPEDYGNKLTIELKRYGSFISLDTMEPKWVLPRDIPLIEMHLERLTPPSGSPLEKALLRGSYLTDLNMFAAAFEEYLAVWEVQAHPALRIALGNLYVKMGFHQYARQCFQPLIQNHQWRASALMAMAALSLAKEDCNSALDFWDRAWALYPPGNQPYINIQLKRDIESLCNQGNQP